MTKLPRQAFPGILFVLSGLLVLAGIAGCTGAPERADLALWRILEAGCASIADGPAGAARPAPPRPGLQCDRARGYAVLKDRCGASHYLVLPLARRPGIESPELLDPAEPPYLALAWAERARVLGQAPGAGPDGAADIGLAVNSRYGRSQSQLHVHVDFVRPEVRATLDALPRPIPPGSGVTLLGHVYRVDPLRDLSGNLFVRVAQGWQARSADERARLTLALLADGTGGFLLLSDRADLPALDRGHAEELLIERHCS